MAYGDEVNLIGNDIKTIERNAKVLLNAWEDIGFAVNTRKTNHKTLLYYFVTLMRFHNLKSLK